MMTIDEQVEYLMQGADFGDASIAATMALDLRARLVESAKTGRPLRVYCGTSYLHRPSPGSTVTMRKTPISELVTKCMFDRSFTAMIGDPSIRINPQAADS